MPRHRYGEAHQCLILIPAFTGAQTRNHRLSRPCFLVSIDFPLDGLPLAVPGRRRIAATEPCSAPDGTAGHPPMATRFERQPHVVLAQHC